MADQVNNCRHCLLPIPEGASICSHCNKSQRAISIMNDSISGIVNLVSIILSIALVSLSWLQFKEATKQRNSADRAALSADIALKQV